MHNFKIINIKVNRFIIINALKIILYVFLYNSYKNK